MSVIGSNIKNIRSKKNLTLKEIAKKCGITEQYLSDIETGRKVPNTQLINSISKVLGVHIDAIEPSYFSDYFEDETSYGKEAPAKKVDGPAPRNVEKREASSNTLSDAFSKATRKIPVLNKITAGKRVPSEQDIVDHKFEPVFQTKTNNVAGEEFIYYIINDNSMSGSRILKGDLALVFLTDSIMDRDILLFTYGSKTFVRRVKQLEDRRLLLYPDNPENEVIIADKKDVSIIGKLVRIEFKL